MSMFDFPCPSCDHILRVSTEHIGKLGTCNHCRERIVVQIPASRRPDAREQGRALDALTQPPRSLGELLGNVSNFLSRFLGCDSEGKAVFFLMDHSSGGIRLATTRGQFSQEFLDDEAFVPLGECLCGRAAQSGQVLVCEDCFNDPRHDHQWLGMQTHGHYVIPLKHQGRVLGVLTIYTRAGVKVNPKRLALLAKVGEHAGNGLYQFLCREKKGSFI